MCAVSANGTTGEQICETAILEADRYRGKYRNAGFAAEDGLWQIQTSGAVLVVRGRHILRYQSLREKGQRKRGPDREAVESLL